MSQKEQIAALERQVSELTARLGAKNPVEAEPEPPGDLVTFTKPNGNKIEVYDTPNMRALAKERGWK